MRPESYRDRCRGWSRTSVGVVAVGIGPDERWRLRTTTEQSWHYMTGSYTCQNIKRCVLFEIRVHFKVILKHNQPTSVGHFNEMFAVKFWTVVLWPRGSSWKDKSEDKSAKLLKWKKKIVMTLKNIISWPVFTFALASLTYSIKALWEYYLQVIFHNSSLVTCYASCTNKLTHIQTSVHSQTRADG